MQKFLSILGITLLLAGCVSKEEQEFRDSGRAKAIIDETDLWMFHEEEDAGFSIRYPHNVELGKNLDIRVDAIETLEGTMGYGRDTALQNRDALKQGNYGKHVDFALDVSQEVLEVGDAHAQQFMVLGRFEVCDITFERKLYFFHNNYQIVLTLFGPKEEIITASPEYFTKDPSNCGDYDMWDHEKQADFYTELEDKKAPEVSQEWFDTFEKIVGTIELYEEAL